MGLREARQEASMSASSSGLSSPESASTTARSPVSAAIVSRHEPIQSLTRVTVAEPAEPVARGADVPFVVTISSPAGTGKSITVNSSTLDGSAKAGKQHEPVRGSLVFTGQKTSKPILVPTMLDTVSKPFKPDRSSIRLTAASGAKIVAAAATATITPIPRGLAISNVTIERARSKHGSWSRSARRAINR
jgi:hypothetical protein